MTPPRTAPTGPNPKGVAATGRRAAGHLRLRSRPLPRHERGAGFGTVAVLQALKSEEVLPIYFSGRGYKML